ncbi:MAG: hypothetical protein ACYCX6_13730 [Vulcanimicrobiaceae bacterium]
MYVLRPIVICCLIVLVFDTVASGISKISGIPYGWFFIPECVMYVLFGAALWRIIRNVRTTLGALLFPAVVETTLGWAISAEIGPGRLPDNHLPLWPVLTVVVIITVVVATLWNVMLGGLGIFIARRLADLK